MRWLISLLLIASCMSGEINYNERLLILGEAYKKYFEDWAFKNNAQCKIFELVPINYDTIDMNVCDSVYLLPRLLYLSNHFKKLADMNIEMAKTQVSMYQLLSDTYYKDKMEEYTNTAQIELDSSKYYLSAFDTISTLIDRRKNPMTLYRLKVFLKATCVMDGKSDNTMDTIVTHFTTDYKTYVPKFPIIQFKTKQK